MKVFYATPHVQQLPPGHRFPMGKYELLRERLDAQGARPALPIATESSSLAIPPAA